MAMDFFALFYVLSLQIFKIQLSYKMGLVESRLEFLTKIGIGITVLDILLNNVDDEYKELFSYRMIIYHLYFLPLLILLYYAEYKGFIRL